MVPRGYIGIMHMHCLQTVTPHAQTCPTHSNVGPVMAIMDGPGPTKAAEMGPMAISNKSGGESGKMFAASASSGLSCLVVIA